MWLLKPITMSNIFSFLSRDKTSKEEITQAVSLVYFQIKGAIEGFKYCLEKSKDLSYLEKNVSHSDSCLLIMHLTLKHPNSDLGQFLLKDHALRISRLKKYFDEN